MSKNKFNKNEDISKKNTKLFKFIFAVLWIISAGFLAFSIVTKPNIIIFLAWNAMAQQNRQSVDFYAKKLQKSSNPIYQKAGKYYAIFSDVMKKSTDRNDTRVTIDNKKDWSVIKQKINKEIQTLNLNKISDTFYYKHLREILAWIYFHEANYTAAADLYLNILIKNEKDTLVRYNYEVSLLLKNSVTSESIKNSTANSASTKKQNIQSDVLSLFKIQKSNSYRLFEIQERDKKLPNY